MLVYLLEERLGDGSLLWQSRYAFAPRHAVRVTPVYHGVPYSTVRDTAKGLFIVASSQVMAASSTQQRAWALFRKLQSIGRTADDVVELAALVRAYLQSLGPITPSDRDVWSLMLIQWVRDIRPDAYFSGVLDLGEAFIADLVPQRGALTLAERAARARLLETIFGNTAELLHRRIGTGQLTGFVNLVASNEIIFQILEREEQIAVARLAAEIGSESLSKAFVMLAGALPALTEILVLNIAFEACVGYIQFLASLREADERESIEPGDEADVWLSFAGIFLPAASEIRYLGEALGLVQMLALAAGLLLALIGALHRLLEASERLLAAAAAGFSDFSEVDPDQALFIPLDEAG